MFRRLGVFVSSFPLSAAEAAACDGEADASEVAEVVWSLVDKSLLIPDRSENETRYRMLDTVRDYARDRLHTDGEAMRTTGDVTTWLLKVAGPRAVRDPQWLHAARVEADNIRGMIELIADTDTRRALELACSIALLHDNESTYRAGVPEVQRYVARLVEPSAERIGLLAWLAYMQYQRGQPVDSAVLAAISALSDAGISEPAWCQGRLGTLYAWVACQGKNYDRAISLARAALQAKELAPLERLRWCNVLAIVFTTQGQLATALPYCEEEASLAHQIQDPRALGTTNSNLAEIHLRLGNRREAASIRPSVWRWPNSSACRTTRRSPSLSPVVCAALTG